LGLALLPLLAVAYVRHERRRRAAAQAFVAAPLLASVVPSGPGWRRHAPLIAYAIAATILLAALARPERTVAIPDERAAIVLAIDHSGSMEATDVSPNRLRAAQSAAKSFLRRVPDRIRIGVVGFDHAARVLQTPTVERAAVGEAIDNLRPTGGTASGEALAASLNVLSRRGGPQRRRAPGAIVLLSDGKSTRGRDPLDLARRARRLRVPIYTIALGTAAGTIQVPSRSGGTERRRVPPDPAVMRRVARLSGGRTFSAPDAESLSSVYEDLGSRVGRRDVQREVTAAFAGGALLLMIGGALMSLHWFHRLP
jgi:Ca-activated chloride channel homolog